MIIITFLLIILLQVIILNMKKLIKDNINFNFISRLIISNNLFLGFYN